MPNFAHPHTLFQGVGKILEKVGPEKFFSSPEEEVKKAREGFAAYFFTLALKEFTGRDWWLSQPDQAERQYPDFDFISFGEEPNPIRIESVELTGVYPHFKTFEEVLKVVEKKQKQYGDEAVRFSLLIFVNHEKSEEWTKMFIDRLETHHPFLSIWTIHLRFKKGVQEVGKIVAHRIRPLPALRVEADTDNPKIHLRQPLPNYVEETNAGGSVYVKFKDDFIASFIKRIRGES